MKKATIFLLLISSILSAQDFDLVPFRVRNKWGFSDSIGKIVIPIKYNNVCPFNKKCAAFQLNKKWGLIDIEGNETVSATYDSVGNYFKEYYVYDNSLKKTKFKTGIEVYQNGKVSYVDINGENLYKNGRVEDAFDFEMYDSKRYLEKIEFLRNGELVGYEIIKTGFSIEPQYDSLIYSDTDWAYFGKKQPEPYFLARKDNKWGVISTSNKTILPFEYDALLEERFNSKKLFKKDGKWGVLDENLVISLENIYDSIARTRAGYLIQLDSKLGVFNYKFEEIIPIIYPQITLSEDKKGYY